jgi:hypothetical protein
MSKSFLLCACARVPLTLQVGAERYNMFTGCPQAKTATIVLRGGSEQVRGCAFAMLGLSEPGLICISG